jgi:hypothetical protein
MSKPLFFLLLLTLPLQLLAGAETVKRVKNLKAFLAQLEKETPETLVTETGREFKLSLSLFAEAIAALDEECFYGGWPSKKVMSGGKSFCTNPKNGADLYTNGSCAPSEIQCQPQLFGANLCVGFATKIQRINTFKNCEDSFKAQKRDYSFVDKLTPQEKEQLKVIEALASSMCDKNPTSATQVMCRKILNRVSDSQVVLPVDDTPVILIPVSAESGTEATDEETKVGGLSEAECAAIVSDDFKKIEDLSQQMVNIVSKYGDRNAGWPREDGDKVEVVDLQEEVLCLELEIYSLSNKLDLKIDCKAKPKKLPPMHMTLVKHDGNNFEEMANRAIQKKIQSLNKIIASQQNSLNSLTGMSAGYYSEVNARINRYKEEVSCLQAIDQTQKCKDAFSGSEVPEYRTKGDFAGLYPSPVVTMMIEKDGKLLPFKTFDQLIIQGGVGPKIKQGDMMTPEGTFNIVSPTTSTNYFSASRIDYENWKERKDMLEGLPNSMVNPGDKGGAILIHGAGGSNGCLSFNSNIESAYFTALSRNKTKAGQPLKMSVYPAAMSEELIESSSSMPDLKLYKNFWSKLSVTYKKEQARTVSSYQTINDIKEKQED